MTRSSTKTVLMLGVALVSLSACAGEKGPGDIGTKNDIVVRNYGETRETAPAGDFSSTVETAQAVPPAEVTQGEALAAPENAVANDVAAQSVAEQSAPVPASTTAPINDGTPAAATPPAQQSMAETPVPAEPVTEQVTPPAAAAASTDATLQSEPYPAPRAVSRAVEPVVSSAPQAYAAPTDVPAGEAVVPVAAVSAATTAAPAPAPAEIAVPANPDAPFYAYVKNGQASSVASATTTASGDVAKVKAALAAKGLYSGAQTNAIDSEFLNALSKYQGENGLPMGGVNAETLQHLGIAQ